MHLLAPKVWVFSNQSNWFLHTEPLFQGPSPLCLSQRKISLERYLMKGRGWDWEEVGGTLWQNTENLLFHVFNLIWRRKNDGPRMPRSWPWYSPSLLSLMPPPQQPPQNKNHNRRQESLTVGNFLLSEGKRSDTQGPGDTWGWRSGQLPGQYTHPGGSPRKPMMDGGGQGLLWMAVRVGDTRLQGNTHQ